MTCDEKKETIAPSQLNCRVAQTFPSVHARAGMPAPPVLLAVTKHYSNKTYRVRLKIQSEDVIAVARAFRFRRSRLIRSHYI